MHVKIIAAAAFILFISGSAVAQEWTEFLSRDDAFTVNFPGPPMVTQTTFKSQFGADLPARVYSVQVSASRYTLTAVDYRQIEQILTEKAKSCPPGAEPCRGGGTSTGLGYWKADLAGALIYSTWQLMQRPGKVTYFGWNNIDQVEGQQVSLANADGSRTSASMYMHENKLYILEGTVPAGYPEPGLFQQSLGWLDANGNGFRYQGSYRNGFPAPPRGGPGGRGQGANPGSLQR